MFEYIETRLRRVSARIFQEGHWKENSIRSETWLEGIIIWGAERPCSKRWIINRQEVDNPVCAG
jgi:hypothetical protein